jgi:hypothetical protein
MKTIKINVWRGADGGIFRTEVGSKRDGACVADSRNLFITTEEMEIKPRMKTVTKELKAQGIKLEGDGYMYAEAVRAIPVSAFNIRILFDIEVEE